MRSVPEEGAEHTQPPWFEQMKKHESSGSPQTDGKCQDVHPSEECQLDHPDTRTQLSQQGMKLSGLHLVQEDVEEPEYIQQDCVTSLPLRGNSISSHFASYLFEIL